MALTKPIPKKIRDLFDIDPFYKKCCIADKNCDGRVQIHHNFRYGGSGRVNELWCLLPACDFHNKNADITEYKDKFDWIMIHRASPADLQKYPKVDWIQRFEYLEKKFKE